MNPKWSQNLTALFKLKIAAQAFHEALHKQERASGRSAKPGVPSALLVWEILYFVDWQTIIHPFRVYYDNKKSRLAPVFFLIIIAIFGVR